MTETKKKAIRLLRKYDKMRNDLRLLERELAHAVRAYADEQGLKGWYDKDKFRVSLMVQDEVRAKRSKAA